MANKSNFYTRTKEINGVTYTAQFSGIALAMKSVDQTYIDGTSNTSVEKMARFILEHAIVDPKVTVEDFESLEELNEVVKFGSAVMKGDFRDRKEPAAGEGKSEK